MKNAAKRFLSAILLLILLCACLSAGAEGKKINLIFIGGDADIEDGPNNTFRNLLLHHEDLRENAENFFIKSTMRDYTNKTAQVHTAEAEACLSPEAVNVVCGYSHGGQSVFFMNTDLVRDLWLFDACVSIGGKCSNPTSNGKVWAEWIIETAKKGVNLHVFASKRRACTSCRTGTGRRSPGSRPQSSKERTRISASQPRTGLRKAFIRFWRNRRFCRNS